MPTMCPTCGQERKKPEPIVSKWRAAYIDRLWEDENGQLHRHIHIPGTRIDSHDYPPGTTVTITAEFKLP